MTGLAPAVLAVAVSPCVDRYAWFEEFQLGVPNRPRRVEVRPGGKAMNASRVLRALGLTVTVVAPLHPSEWPWWVEQSSDEGIRVSPCAARRPTRMTMTCIDEAANRATEIYEPGPRLSSEEWAHLGETVREALSEEDREWIVAIAGSRPGGDGGALAGIVGYCRGRGIPVYLDGYGPAIVDALRAGPTVLKVNLDEARSLLGRGAQIDAEQAATGLVAVGANIAIVTVGVEGAASFDGHNLRRIPGPAKPAPFPGGSGDAFFAGLIAARIGGLPLDAALRQAQRCAEANATSPYAGWVQPNTDPVEPT